MPHYIHKTFELNDECVMLKLELESAYPQEPRLLLRTDDEQQERPLSFEQQTNGHDDFEIAPIWWTPKRGSILAGGPSWQNPESIQKSSSAKPFA